MAKPALLRQGYAQHCSAACKWAHDATVPVSERLAKWIDRSSPDGCWPWFGYNTKGYGRVTIHRKIHSATRLILEEKLGRPLRPGMFACHHCDNPPCCRPDHLFEGSSLENNRDRARKGRSQDQWGENNPSVRLTAAQVQEMRALYAGGGISQQALGAKYGIGQGAVSGIVLRRTWRRLP
jgi:hypothetical protein